MKIPETPASVSDLDLMKRLDAYAQGKDSWRADEIGSAARKACRTLHTHIVSIVDEVLAPIMNRATARELDTFTMHDERHGRKVAHLMWHILSPDRRSRLTPPEIGILVIAAHLHDAGMALSREEREKRLAPDSDLWDRAEASPTVKHNLKRLRDMLTDAKLAETKRIRIESELFQAEEALLALDTRERHATRERYGEIIAQLNMFHSKDPTRIPDVEGCFSFDGDSFRKKLIDICVSHNEEADALVERDREQLDRPRFPQDYPVGLATADTHLLAAALRLADILDFDRERTPATLFHYLVPSSLSHGVNISELEWNKHLSVSNWEIEQPMVVFRGRCKNHIVHHAVVQFCRAIEEEITSTKATFALGRGWAWPFVLPEVVKADIHEDGYHYMPYQFELDDARVYDLLMGRAIYNDPLVALRELVQNAVDACSYRDVLTKLSEPSIQPDTKNRITIRYEEPYGDREYPLLSVIDTGTGMDQWLIERWFLKVGRSYYSSTEFAWDRVQLRKNGIDFAPVSEFGIGFLSCFLLADRVTIETAMWEPIRGDTRRRQLEIDGPTRLIRMREDANTGLQRLRGTRVSLPLVRGGSNPDKKSTIPPTWAEVRSYLEVLCLDLPYRLNIEHVEDGKPTVVRLDAQPLRAYVPPPFEKEAFRIPVDNSDVGLQGEIAIVPYPTVRRLMSEKLRVSSVEIASEPGDDRRMLLAGPPTHRPASRQSALLRGGFNVGPVPGIPTGMHTHCAARIRMLSRASDDHRYFSTNLARTAVTNETVISAAVFEAWMTYLLDRRTTLPEGFLYDLGQYGYRHGPFGNWLERYSALSLYELARNGWHYALHNRDKGIDPVADWECRKSPAARYRIFLFGELLELVLPRVVPNVTVAGVSGDVFIEPPVNEWRDVLGACHDFISNPVPWPLFGAYAGNIADLMLDTRARFFNLKYADRLRDFSPAELQEGARIFDALLTARLYEKRPAILEEADAALLSRFFAAVGDLTIRSVWGTCRLDSFATTR
jgi:Histidine kinase-, DNA gyrase B-, and HSP90-like ATPase